MMVITVPIGIALWITLLVGALVGLGIPKEKALKYETEIKADQFMVIVSGMDEEVNQAQQILKNANHEVNELVAV